MTSIDVFGLGMPRWRWYAAIAMSASCWVTVLALSVGGGWYFHSGKVSSTAFFIQEVAHG